MIDDSYSHRKSQVTDFLQMSYVQPFYGWEWKRQMIKPFHIPIRRRSIDAFVSVARVPIAACSHSIDKFIPLRIVGQSTKLTLHNDTLQLLSLVRKMG